jgi:hypothetical protein
MRYTCRREDRPDGRVQRAAPEPPLQCLLGLTVGPTLVPTYAKRIKRISEAMAMTKPAIS